MLSKFAFYSTEITATTDPRNANPQPAILVFFETDPMVPGKANYETEKQSSKRGSVFQTLGAIQVQSFGVVAGDRRIGISDVDALTQSVVTSLDALYASDSQYYFTDGVKVWKVMFDFQNGFRKWMNVLAATFFWPVYSYEINLIVIEGPY